MAIVTLTTDFGVVDEYVGVMKGVILSVDPAITVVDITHGISPQDIAHGSLLLGASWRYFPAGTVHTAVVDPGVGGERAIVCVRVSGHLFLAPDNGLLTHVLAEGDADLAVRVEKSRYFNAPVSPTFHGRDIFAPVSARLALGVAPEELGRRVNIHGLTRFPAGARSGPGAGSLKGRAVCADRFGNILTDIHRRDIEGIGPVERLTVTAGAFSVMGIRNTYQTVPHKAPLAVFGSRDYLELSVNCGSAAAEFGIETGALVTVAV